MSNSPSSRTNRWSHAGLTDEKSRTGYPVRGAPLLSRARVHFSIGLLHAFLAAAVVFVLVETRSQPWPAGVYSAVGLALVFGVLFMAGRPRFIQEESLAGIIADSLAVSVLVGATGGEGSSFFALFLLAAFGVSRTTGVARSVAGGAVLFVGYAAAVSSVEGFGGLLSPSVGFEAVLLALSCAAAAALGAKLRDTGNARQFVFSALARERRYVEQAEALLTGIGPLLENLSREGMARWTARAARESLGAPYAHVATLDGHLHQTSAGKDGDAYPSWWHPEIQRLLLSSCRTGEVARGDTPVHDMEKFVAVPMPLEGTGSMGAIILGGKSFSTEDERTIELLACQVAPILGRSDEAPGGRDPVSGVPNRDSFHRVVRRELSRPRPLTILLVDLGLNSRNDLIYGHGTEGFLLRQTAKKLLEMHQYVFRYSEDTFIALSGAGAKKAAAAALETRRVVDQLTDASGLPSASVGFATTGAGQKAPSLLLDAALEALARAKSNPDRIAGPPASTRDQGPESLLGGDKGSWMPREIQALAETIEVRDPDLGEHSRAVSHLASLIGSKMALSREQMNILVPASLLHDIGKIGIADNILHKPASLSTEEYEIIKQHPLFGARILNSIPELAHITLAVKHHHERFDGKGYPDGLCGEHIPLTARIISVADTLDTITRDRPYRRGRSEKEALCEIARNSGVQFDPEVVRALQEVAEEPDTRKLSS